LWIGLVALFVVGVFCLVVFLLLRPAPVWVGDIPEFTHDDLRDIRGVGVSYTVEADYEHGGGLWVTVTNEQGRSVAAWVVENGRKESVRNELEEAAKDMPAACAMIRAGWIPNGCSAVKALGPDGRVVEAAKFPFSPKAHQVVVDAAAIKKAKDHRD